MVPRFWVRRMSCDYSSYWRRDKPLAPSWGGHRRQQASDPSARAGIYATV